MCEFATEYGYCQITACVKRGRREGMSRVKGKYVATVTIEWDQEREPNMLPLQDIKENAKFLTQTITGSLMDAVMGKTNIEVTEQCCDFWEVEDE